MLAGTRPAQDTRHRGRGPRIRENDKTPEYVQTIGALVPRKLLFLQQPHGEPVHRLSFRIPHEELCRVYDVELTDSGWLILWYFTFFCGFVGFCQPGPELFTSLFRAESEVSDAIH